MTVYYARHRGSLRDALKARRAFSSTAKAVEYAISEPAALWGTPMFTEEDVYIRYDAYDPRIQCEAFLLCTGRYGKEDYIDTLGHPQACGRLYFGPEWQDKVQSWFRANKAFHRPAAQFIAHFDGPAAPTNQP